MADTEEKDDDLSQDDDPTSNKQEDQKSDDDAAADDAPSGDDEIPVRRSSPQAFHVIGRLKQKNEELKTQLDKRDVEDDEDGSDAMTPEAKSAVQREIEKAVQPLKQQTAQTLDEQELKELFSGEPEAKKHEQSIRRYMKHPAWSHVPVSAIYHHIAFKKGGDTDAADLEARQGRTGGTPLRPKESGSDLPDVANMSDEEFEKLQNEAKRGVYLPEDDPRK